MGLRFRKSFKIAPGVRINLGKSGVSTTIGGKGASINIGKKGIYGNTSIPGTGISAREKLFGGSTSRPTNQSYIEENSNSESNQIAQKPPFVRNVGLGIITLMLIWFCQDSPNLIVFGAIFFAFRAVFYFLKRHKPVYGEQPVYKQDCRFKSGQRLEGYQKVKIGTEPLNHKELRMNSNIAFIRLTFFIVLIATWCWLEYFK